MFTDYQEVIHYLYQALPMFQRVGAIAYKKDLTNTLALCNALDNPQHKFKSIHVAGTNGKGSTSHMLASVLQSAGYKTGLYTSPHLKEFTERIRINGIEVDQQFLIDFANRIKPALESIKPSFFEVTVAMSFDYFARQQVDIAIIEVGLGGRLDSTNVIIPEVSLITNIGYDHMDLLGDTLPKIAFEKAGVIKSGVPVVVSERQPEVEMVFKEIAVEREAKLFFAQDEYACSRDKTTRLLEISKNLIPIFKGINLPLYGEYQRRNLPGVMKTIDLLRSKDYRISDEAIQSGLENILTQTGLKGRWQQLGEHPTVICDTGHNVDGIREILSQINEFSFERLFIVIGMVKDKKRDEILKLLPTSATYYFCQAKIPRACEANVLATEALPFGLSGEVIPDVNDAIAKAKSIASPNDFIFIGGSTFVVAEIDNL